MLTAITNNSIRYLMRTQGKTQRDLAGYLGKSLGYVSARFNNRDGQSWDLVEIEAMSEWLGEEEINILTGDVYAQLAA